MTDSTGSPTPTTYHLRRRTTGTFLLVPCPRLRRSIRCQGQLEGAAATILAACPRLDKLQEQPLSIWYRWLDSSHGLQIKLLPKAPDGRARREKNCSYIVPDFFVELNDGRQFLLEIKPASRLADPKTSRKLQVGQKFARVQGWTFLVLTERELSQGPLLANVRLLSRFRRILVEDSHAATILALVAVLPRRIADLLTLCSKLGTPSQIRSNILHLVATGRLDWDPREACLSDESLLFPGGTQPWDPFDWPWGRSGSSTVGHFESYGNSVLTSSSPKT